MNSVSTENIKYYMTRCNRCLACRIYKGYQMSNRLLAESRSWKYAYFITLTFNDQNYYKVNLDKPMREFQLFMKRLRKKFKGQKFKYFTVAELGGQTLRFHYHMILFSNEHVFYDMRPKLGQPKYYTSVQLDKLWKNGFHLIAWAEHNSMRYCANYVNGPDNVAKSMSNGLGSDYIINNNNDNLYVVGGKFSTVPRSMRLKAGVKTLSSNDLNEIKDIHNQLLEINSNTGEFVEIQDKIKDRVLKKQFYRKKT